MKYLLSYQIGKISYYDALEGILSLNVPINKKDNYVKTLNSMFNKLTNNLYK